MGNLFNMDGKLMGFLSRIADLVILNLLFLLCCLPVVTIGAATTALYYMTLKMTKNEEAYIVKGYFKSFKENIKQSTIIWIITLFVAAVLILDFWIVTNSTMLLAKVILIVLSVLLLIFIFTLTYIFPVLSRFENTVKNTLKNAFLISIVNLPYTLLLLVIYIVVLGLSLYFFFYAIPYYFLAGFSVLAFATSFIYRKILDKYINTNNADEEM